MPTWFEQFDGPLPGLPLAHALVYGEDLADLSLDRVQRIERGHRLLEDHRDVVAADLAQFLLGGGEQVPSVEQDAAARVCRRAGQQLQDGQRGDRFSRPGFADQRDGLARIDVERDPVDRQRLGSGLVECDREIVDGEKRFGRHGVLLT